MNHETDALLPHNVGAAIFDFDGTLADTAHLWHEVDQAFMSRRGLPLEPDYPERLAALGFAEGARYTIERYNLRETVADVCAEWMEASKHLYRTNVTLRPGASSYIRALREHGVPCALATTNGSAILESMDHVDVRELFDVRVYGAEVKRGKDHPDIYLEAARRLDVAPESCVVFEDIVPALQSARRAGALACGVRANDPRQPVEQAKGAADVWLDDWCDLTDA